MRLPVIHKLKVNNVGQGFFEEEQFNEVCSLLRPDYQVAVLIAKTIAVHLRIFWPADLVLAHPKLPVIPESRDSL
jgi:hypothetical protein